MPSFDPAAPLVHPLPDSERVELRPGLVYAEAGGRELAMDRYLPADRAPGSRLPAVLLVHGEAPPQVLRGVRGWGQYTGWGRLLAGEGLVGLAVEHHAVAEVGFEGAVAEVGAALAAARDRAGELGLDPDRLALAGFSAGVPLTAAALTGPAAGIRCAALCYGPLDGLDPDAALPPLLIVRAGRDRPALNRTIEEFVTAAEARRLPIELVDHPDGHHAFDVLDDTDASRDAIRRVLSFLRQHLLA
jgi:acetyl esterase/lipase